MKGNTLKAAFYGKGGIGKTTIACNVSAFLAWKGYKILHIGCDPKGDSTRLLSEKRIPRILDQINTLGADIDISDVIFRGTEENLYIAETGGPRAGVGCAGAGITVMHELLTDLGVFEMDWDIIIYDVLGDVVCGGFSVPMKSAYVDKVFVVSSSEYMSLYAANNILQAIDSFSYDHRSLLGGMIWNHCQSDWDRKVAEGFAGLTGAEVILFLDECREIRKLDYQKKLFVKEHKESGMTKQIAELAEYILSIDPGEVSPETAGCSCSPEQLEAWSESVMTWN